MKKIFTLLLSFGLFTSIFAQYPGNQRGQGRDKDEAYNDNRKRNDDNRFDDHFNFNKREMDMRIADINRDYDRKIRQVNNNWYMNRFKKERMIRSLEDQRRDEIRMVYVKYNDKRNRYGYNEQKKHW